MTPLPRDEGRRWIREAQAEMKAAEYLLGGGYHNVVCFHAQQAAEKAVKGFLLAQGADDPWGHSVGNLLADATTYDATLESLRSLASSLDKFYIPTRYPNGLPGGLPSQAYTQKEASDALDTARTLLSELEQRI